MRYNIKKYVFNMLKNHAPLVSALGGVSKIVPALPDTFTNVPMLYYREIDQHDTDYKDNVVYSVSSTFDIQLYTAWSVSPQATAKIITTLFSDNMYNMDYSEDFPDPDRKFQRIIMRFSRKFTADEAESL